MSQNELIESSVEQPEMINSNMAIFDQDKFAQIVRFAEMMASGNCTIPQHLKKSKGDCLAVTMQAVQWGMNPFAVAQKTSLVSGTLAYEAQLVNAVVSSSAAIKGRFKYDYVGDWEKVCGKKPKKKKNHNDKWVTEGGWSGDSEIGLYIKVGAVVAGEDEITWGEPVYLASVDIRNSPLWATHVKQQIAYLAVKMWCRMYTPDVIMGVYTPEEIQVKDITPSATVVDDLNSRLEDQETSKEVEGEVIKGKSAYSLAKFEKEMKAASTPDQINALAEKAKRFSGEDKKQAGVIYKARIAELKKQAIETTIVSLDEALALLARATDQDGIDVAIDYANGLDDEGATIFASKLSSKNIEGE